MGLKIIKLQVTPKNAITMSRSNAAAPKISPFLTLGKAPLYKIFTKMLDPGYGSGTTLVTFIIIGLLAKQLHMVASSL